MCADGLQTDTVKREALVCRYCYALKVVNDPPENQFAMVMAKMVLESDDLRIAGCWAPMVCPLHRDGWSATDPLPDECPYVLEHVLMLDKRSAE